MGELLPVLFKCILKEILSLLSLDETVQKFEISLFHLEVYIKLRSGFTGMLHFR